MLPTLVEGDRLLVRYDVVPRRGDVVVCRFPDATLAVKRATASVRGGWWVERDNPREGVDSALVGPVAPDDLLGVAVVRLWPRPRRLRRRGD
ncbi:hypothetical protein GCM10011519_13590 [Marmoricola endophyticus]|uniref:S26 family signal peptidase n=2 Tax=Marmoricola endophyticus TaxID=2040280 RepID=A0A917F3D5_9ACTN|nr:hypothetical protein GCM10011519_13590 [Marmoricola endophyticus]